MSNAYSSLIIAAGGLVERRTGRDVEIALVRRVRYGEEWALPKGKLKEKEQPWDAALREVLEETGCDAKLREFAGTTQYKHGETPKIVLFWRMEVSGDCVFQSSEEVKEVRWLPPAEAIRQLTHADEKILVAKTYGLSGSNPGHAGGSSRAQREGIRWWFSTSRRLQCERLANAVAEYRTQLEWRICRDLQTPLGSPPYEDLCWAAAARKSLDEAREALKQSNVDGGWQSLQAAQSMEIWGYSTDELKQRATALRREAEDKLGGWRKKAIVDLLGDGSSPAALDNGQVYRAALIRDEHYRTLYYRIGMRRTQLRFVWATLILFVAVLPLLAWGGIAPGAFGDWKTVLVVELFGTLGALFSVAITLTSQSVRARIPDQVVASFVTWMRPAIGAAAAVVGYLLFRGGLLIGVFQGDAASTDPSIAVLLISFVSGFSERLVIGALDTITTAAAGKSNPS